MFRYCFVLFTKRTLALTSCLLIPKMATATVIVRRTLLLQKHYDFASPCLQCHLKFNTRDHPIVHLPKRNYASKQAEDKVKPPLRSQRYAFNKMIHFITSSSGKLEKQIPNVFRVYRTFKAGVSSFLTDTKEFYGISSKLWAGHSLTNFTRTELELYRQFSSEIPLISFLLLIAFAPGGALVFPLAYMFPRHLLSRHFWTPEQVEEFRKIEMVKRLKHYDSILDCMHIQSQHIDNESAKCRVRKVMSKLDTSVSLTSSEVLALKPLFEGRPYKIDSVSIRHLRHLGKSLGMSLRRKKLTKEALLLHYTDLAMHREGVERLSEEELDKACAWRGLNPEGVSPQGKISYLTSWMTISCDVKESSISLLLHLPVLLGYCRSSNRSLMGSRSSKDRRSQF